MSPLTPKVRIFSGLNVQDEENRRYIATRIQFPCCWYVMWAKAQSIPRQLPTWSLRARWTRLRASCRLSAVYRQVGCSRPPGYHTTQMVVKLWQWTKSTWCRLKGGCSGTRKIGRKMTMLRTKRVVSQLRRVIHGSLPAYWSTHWHW